MQFIWLLCIEFRCNYFCSFVYVTFKELYRICTSRNIPSPFCTSVHIYFLPDLGRGRTRESPTSGSPFFPIRPRLGHFFQKLVNKTSLPVILTRPLLGHLFPILTQKVAYPLFRLRQLLGDCFRQDSDTQCATLPRT